MNRNFPRLFKALAKSGVEASYDTGVYTLRKHGHEARVLLPASLPLEAKAVSQLLAFASVSTPEGVPCVCQACATPDFHPGTYAPVGTVVATPEDVVIPHALGTDLNCGISLYKLGLTHTEFLAHKARLVPRLSRLLLENERNFPIPSIAYRALFDHGPEAFLDSLLPQGMWADVDKDRLNAELAHCVGLSTFEGASRHAPEALMPSREIIRDPQYATIGSSNHYTSIERVSRLMDKRKAFELGLKLDDMVAMIHSGSREVGFYVGGRWMDKAKQAWPRGQKHPESGLYTLEGPLAREYLLAMGVAARYAWANRMGIAELLRKGIRDVMGEEKTQLIVDVPHNVILQENGLNIHRKGATPANAGQLALIPGSMGTSSYLVTGLGNPDWLWSCSHGAGRSVRRQELRRRKAPQAPAGWECVTLREERRIEEAPEAYKPIGPVLDAQVAAGMLTPLVEVVPVVTFKA